MKWMNSPFLRSSFGVLEPQSEKLYLPEMIDLLIVPGIIYNRAGYRIGLAVVITTGI